MFHVGRVSLVCGELLYKHGGWCRLFRLGNNESWFRSQICCRVKLTDTCLWRCDQAGGTERPCFSTRSPEEAQTTRIMIPRHLGEKLKQEGGGNANKNINMFHVTNWWRTLLTCWQNSGLGIIWLRKLRYAATSAMMPQRMDIGMFSSLFRAISCRKQEDAYRSGLSIAALRFCNTPTASRCQNKGCCPGNNSSIKSPTWSCAAVSLQGDATLYKAWCGWSDHTPDINTSITGWRVNTLFNI